MRRRPARHAAVAVTIGALLLASCGDDSEPVDDLGPTTAPATLDVPTEHGLSDERVGRVLASTVGVSGVACGRSATGSGFALASDLVVTSAHVILGIDDIRIHTFDGLEVGAVPVAFDPIADLAILRLDDVELEPLSLSLEAGAGDIGMLVGWERAPFPDPTPFRIDKPVTVRIEEVGSDARIERPAYLLAANVDIGDSGAALVDQAGDVIGVVFAASIEGDGVGYAVRASEVDALLADGLDVNLSIPDC